MQCRTFIAARVDAIHVPYQGSGSMLIDLIGGQIDYRFDTMTAAMAKRMNADITKVLAMPDVAEKFEQYGAEDGGGSNEKFGNFIVAEANKWARVVKAAGDKVEA